MSCLRNRPEPTSKLKDSVISTFVSMPVSIQTILNRYSTQTRSSETPVRLMNAAGKPLAIRVFDPFVSLRIGAGAPYMLPMKHVPVAPHCSGIPAALWSSFVIHSMVCFALHLWPFTYTCGQPHPHLHIQHHLCDASLRNSTSFAYILGFRDPRAPTIVEQGLRNP